MTTYGTPYGTGADTGASASDMPLTTNTQDSTSSQTKDAASDAARQTAGTAAAQAGQVASTAKDKAADVASTAKEQAGQVLGEARGQASDLIGQVREQASTQAGQQQERAATTLRSFSDELRSMTDNSEQNGMATSLTRQLSEQTSSLASYLEQKQPMDLLDDVRAFARRRPGAFLLGAAVAGVVAGRMFRGTKDASSGSSGSPQTPASSPAPALGTIEAAALPTGDTDRPHGDMVYEKTSGRDALGERNPTAGPLSTSYGTSYGDGGRA